MERNESRDEAGICREVTEDLPSRLDGNVVQRVFDARTRMYGENGEEYQFKLNGATLISLEKLMKLLLYTDEMPYKIRRDRDGHEYGQPKKMAFYFQQFSAFMKLRSPIYYYAPDFELFFKVLWEHPIYNYSFVDWEPRGDERLSIELNEGVDIEYVAMAHDFVQIFRKSAASSGLKKAMSEWRSGPKDNRKYLAERLKNILLEHSRIVVVNLVFLYRKAACKGRIDAQARGLRLFERHITDYQAYMEYADDMENVTVPDHMVGLEELKDDLNRFLNNRRHNKLFSKDKFIDYFGRIEFAEESGFHVHICFLYRGSHMREGNATFYSHEIGKYWMKVTEGRGYYSSVNALVDSGEYRGREGIGVVNHDDFEKIAHMWRALSYFVKADQVVRIKHKKRAQMFLHGKPRNRLQDKRGRPRESGMSSEEYLVRLEKIFV